jgi:hypothetical protein
MCTICRRAYLTSLEHEKECLVRLGNILLGEKRVAFLAELIARYSKGEELGCMMHTPHEVFCRDGQIVMCELHSPQASIDAGEKHVCIYVGEGLLKIRVGTGQVMPSQISITISKRHATDSILLYPRQNQREPLGILYALLEDRCHPMRDALKSFSDVFFVKSSTLW